MLPVPPPPAPDEPKPAACQERLQEALPDDDEPRNPIRCPRCKTKLDFVGTKKFHEGTRAWDFLGGIWELFKNREHFDVYVCPRCGRVELFVDGVGEEFRPH